MVKNPNWQDYAEINLITNKLPARAYKNLKLTLTKSNTLQG